MNKFFTPRPGLGLVFFSVALGWGKMILHSEPQLSEPPAQETGGVPTSLALERFEPLVKKSPFTAAASPEETAGFAQELTLAGFVRLDGEDFVMVASRNSPERFLVGKKPSPSARGIVLLEVQRDPKGDPTKMKAKVQKGQETATLAYEKGPTAAPVAGQPPVPGVVPGVPVPPGQGAPQGAQPPGQAKQAPAPVFHRRVIPIPPAPAR